MYSCVPIAPRGTPSTSAATVAFQHRPMDASHAAANVGSAEGTYTRHAVRSRPKRNMRAISNSRGSVEAMPSIRLAYTTGSTISTPVSTGTLSARSHTSARMMNDVTGVARTTVIAGAISCRSAGSALAPAASSAAPNTPSA